MQLQLKQCVWIISFLLAAVGISGLPALAASTHLRTTLTVGCSPGPNNYHTIQDAVNAAGENYTIKVCKGKYSENVNINDATMHGAPPFDSLDGLQIVAQEGVQLHCPGAGNNSTHGSGFDLHSYAITITGFDIEDCASAISVEYRFAGEKFSNNTLHNNVVGISFNGESYLDTVVDNEIFRNSGDGVFDFGTGGDTIVDNYIHDNGGNGIQISTTAIVVGGVYTALITDNEIEQNAGNGVYLNNANYVLVNQNMLSENGNDGLYLNTSFVALVFGNEADQNHNIGIEASSGSHGSTFEDNSMDKNLAYDASDHDTNHWYDNSCASFTAGAHCDAVI